MILVDDLALKRATVLKKKPGNTCSGVSTQGTATEWELRCPGQPLMTVHDTCWDNGERDLVLYQPALIPEIPAPLSNLHNRLRIGVTRAPGGRSTLRMMAFPAWVHGQRPRIKRSLTTAQLAHMVGLPQLRDLVARPGVALHPAGSQADSPGCDLVDPQDVTSFQHALHFPETDEETPVIAFTYIRIVPVLRHVGWLPKVAL